MNQLQQLQASDPERFTQHKFDLMYSLMLDFDKEYYSKLYEFFNTNNNKTYNIVPDLTTEANKEKFIAHVLLYQRLRKPEDGEIILSFDHKQLHIVELFQNVLNGQITNKFIKEYLGFDSPEIITPVKSFETPPIVTPSTTPDSTQFTNPW